MDVMVVPLRRFEFAPGSPTEPGTPIKVPSLVAERWVKRGDACYYSDYSASMLLKDDESNAEVRKGRQSRIVKASVTEAETEVPGE